MKFNVIILNSEKVKVDEIIVESDSVPFALLDAQKIFLSNHSEFEFLDAGMWVGSNSRDLTVLNKNTSDEEYYELKIKR